MNQRITRIEQQERTRMELIEAAHKVFIANGYTATSLQAICREAACTTGAIYSNFSGKEDLFFAVLESRTRVQEGLWTGLKSRIGEPDFRLQEFGETLVAALPDVQWQDYYAEFRATASASPESSAKLRKFYEQANDNMAALLERLCNTYRVSPPHPYRDLAILVRSMTEGLLLFNRINPDTPVAVLFTAGVRQLVLGDDNRDAIP